MSSWPKVSLGLWTVLLIDKFLHFPIQVDPSGKYDNIVSIQQFRDKFKLAGGINLPKILTVVGSDGVERRQLVKVIPSHLLYQIQSRT